MQRVANAASIAIINVEYNQFLLQYNQLLLKVCACVCVCVCYDVSSGLHNSLGVHLFRLLDSTIRYEHVSVASTAYNIHVAVFHSSEGTFDSSEHTPICNRASFLSTAIRTAPLRRIAVDGDLAVAYGPICLILYA